MKSLAVLLPLLVAPTTVLSAPPLVPPAQPILPGPDPASPSPPAADNAPAAAPNPLLPRLVIYYQTTHNKTTGAPISMLPLVTEKHIALTHLIVCSFHVNAGGVVHLNDYPPETQLFDVMWAETEVLRDAGVRIMGMVGGAAPGSFSAETLDSTDPETFAYYYGQLADVIRQYRLQGLDIDVEQPMSLRGIVRLVRALRADFGPEFDITLAPVASALMRGGWANLSGFNYTELETIVGSEIAWYNAQFYNGFGSMATPAAYESAVTAPGTGFFPPDKVLAGQVTTPKSGSQWTPFPIFNATIRTLMERYPPTRTVNPDDGSVSVEGGFGGVMGWEYFDGEPGGTEKPWVWAQIMTEVLRPGEGMVPSLRITRDMAAKLDAAWRRSSLPEFETEGVPGGPDVDYFAMVNA